MFSLFKFSLRYKTVESGADLLYYSSTDTHFLSKNTNLTRTHNALIWMNLTWCSVLSNSSFDCLGTFWVEKVPLYGHFHGVDCANHQIYQTHTSSLTDDIHQVKKVWQTWQKKERDLQFTERYYSNVLAWGRLPSQFALITDSQLSYWVSLLISNNLNTFTVATVVELSVIPHDLL